MREASAALDPPTRSRSAVAIAVTLALWIGYATIAATLSLLLHPIPLNEAESDNFLRGVFGLLQGGPCIDTYHPAHTALAGWLIVKSTGCEPFTALRMLAALSGGAIVTTTFWLARRFGASPLGAGVATLSIALHPGLLLLSMQASADALATAGMAATLLAAVHARSSTRGRDTVLCGLVFGFAVGTRYSCIGFAPALLAAVHRGRIGGDVVRVTIGGAIGYLPHAVVSTLQFGSPFVTDNWRNIVLKHGGYDPRLLYDTGYPNLFAFLHDHWVESVQLGAADVWRQLRGVFGEAFSGLPMPIATLVGAVVFAAIVALAVRRCPAGVVFGGCFVAHLALVCSSYAPIERVLLPLFPMAAVALGSLVRRDALRSSALGVATLAVVCTSLGFHLPSRLARFVDAHPFREIEVARTLADRPEVEVLATSYGYMPQFGPPSVHVSAVAPGDEGQVDPYSHLRRQRARSGANAFLLGRRTAPDSYRAVRAAKPPGDVRILHDDDDVVAVVFDVDEDGARAGRWFASFTATPVEWRDGSLDMEVELVDDCDVTLVAAVLIRLELPAARGPGLELPARGERRFGVAWPLKPPPGTWQLASRLRLRDGRYVRGPIREIRVL